VRRAFVALVLLALVIAGALLLRTSKSPDSVDAGTAPTIVDAGAPAVLVVKIVKLEGTVEIKRDGKDAWEPATVGATLSERDAIRTSTDASAELDAAGNIVSLMGGTDVKVAELTTGLTRYLLGKGLITGVARSSSGAGKLAVDVDGTDVAVRATDGSFRVSSNGTGTVAVAAQDGDVSVAAKGKEIVLHKGQRTLVLPNEAPTEPQALATSLLLKVQWPKERETNKRVVTITGRTEAGALVFAMGKPVQVGADGKFSEKVTLPDGETTLRVTASDVSGNSERAAGPRILVDTQGATSKFKTEDLWKQPR